MSLLLATQFRTHAATYQTASAKAAVIHEQFVTTLATSASSYADTEAANAVVTG
ncbi:PE family protein [Mycobacterium tuberculosis]|uniref:PE family protein n=1 Tax=Mycobacterium tuberculosis TaxID=1773 RepID=UPI0007647DFB|nr:PE family protein PE31 [Mycobacterium tuberculosis variant bovis]